MNKQGKNERKRDAEAPEEGVARRARNQKHMEEARNVETEAEVMKRMGENQRNMQKLEQKKQRRIQQKCNKETRHT